MTVDVTSASTGENGGHRFPPMWLVGIPLVLTGVSFAAKVSWRWLDSSVIRLVDVMSERNIPTWYMTATLFLGGVLAAVTTYLMRNAGVRGARVWAWRAVAAFMIVLSIDELVSVHEQVGRWLRPFVEPALQAMAGSSLDSILRTGWIVPGIVVLSGVAIALFLWGRLVPRRVGVPVGTGFLIMVAGGLGMEIVGSIVYDYPIPLLVAGHIEELLEMWGAAVMTFGLSRALGWSAHSGTLRLTPVEAIAHPDQTSKLLGTGK